jgi:hypothetical protein
MTVALKRLRQALVQEQAGQRGQNQRSGMAPHEVRVAGDVAVHLHQDQPDDGVEQQSIAHSLRSI